MTPTDLETLRRASAHIVVAEVAAPDVDDDTRHHLFRVLRVRDGDAVTVTDGAGRWRVCRVAAEALVPDGEIRSVARRPADGSGGAEPLTIAWAIPKRERPEWIVQKLTELGVDRIVLLHAERSVVRWGSDRAARNLAKLRKTAIEAVQQSRGVYLPELVGPIDATSFLPGAVVAEPGGRAITTADRTIAIGPEGGWTDDELGLAADQVTLGDRVLRVETATVVAATRLIERTA